MRFYISMGFISCVHYFYILQDDSSFCIHRFNIPARIINLYVLAFTPQQEDTSFCI